MKDVPAWVKILGVLLLFAVLYGAARVLLLLDKAPSGKVGLD